MVERLLGVRLPEPRGCILLATTLALVTWVPLALLSALRGVALPGRVDEPFFHDITPHVRFLFALPLLIVADLLVGPVIARVSNQFVATGLVSEESVDKFDAIVRSALKLRDSNLAELVVVAVAYATAAYNIHRELGTGISSWLAVETRTALKLTLAGWWYIFFSVPVYQFVLFRWILRLCNFALLMGRISRLDLRIMPTHPDRAAGLGFVGQVLAPASLIVLAASSVLCSSIGTQVMYRGAELHEFALAFGFFVLIALMAFLMPFAVFIPKLALARREGLITYGALATRYTQLFDRKWVARQGPASEELLGTADIQSLADIGNSFDRVDNMKLFPVEVRDLRALLAAAILPAIPLALTQVSLKDVAHILAQVLF